MTDHTDSQNLWGSLLGKFVPKRPRQSTDQASLESRQYEVWRKTDAFLQYDDEQQRKKRRVLRPEEPSDKPGIGSSDADSAVLVRRHLISLDNALRMHWVCICDKCSGLSVRLLLPQYRNDLDAEASFEVLFGVRRLSAKTLQEARITVR
jgi:hypothetical protein